MKSVLISIRPKWCELIASGEKTIEVRKTRPKLEPPFRCYIYCTLQGAPEFFRETIGGDVAKWNRGKWAERKGNVIGEFTCDVIFSIFPIRGDISEFAGPAYMTKREMYEYLNATSGYGWHVSDLKIYDKPKRVSEFWYPPEKYCEKEFCGGCPGDQVADVNGEYSYDCEWRRPLSRPPQSWCYVEGV